MDTLFVEKQYAGAEADYRRSLRATARSLWAGTMDIYAFIDTMLYSIRRGFTLAWREGSDICGIGVDDISAEEISELNSAINTEMTRVIGYGDFILRNSKKIGGKVNTILARADMWGGSYAMVRSQAMTMACADKKLKWVWNPIKEHCDSCRKLNGRTYRASTWRRYDIYPRMWRLRCHGKYCGCEFQITTDPVTPGRPPNI